MSFLVPGVFDAKRDASDISLKSAPPQGSPAQGKFGGVPVRTAVVLSFATRIFTAAVTLISAMVTARFLTPEETGVFALGFTLALFVQIISENGFTNYIVQEKDLTDEKVRATFTITLILAWSAGGLFLLASGPAAAFYKAPTLADVMSVLAISLFVLPFRVSVIGLLTREFRFAELYAITAASASIAAVVSITLAMLGFGAVSMAWGSAASATLVTIYVCLTRPAYALMKPTLYGWSPTLAFGGQTTLASIVIQLTESAMRLLTGWMLGLYLLGLFNRAYYLALNARGNVLGSATSIAFPVLASEIRDGRDIRRSYLRVSSLLTGVMWPIHGFLIVMAYPTIHLLYGPQWDGAVPLFRLLLLGDLLFVVFGFGEATLLALGRADYWVRGTIIVQGARIALIVPAMFYSIEAVCIAESLHYVVFLVVFGRILVSVVGLTLRDIIHAHAKSALLTLCSIVGPTISVLALASAPGWVTIIVGAAGCGTGWLLGVFLLKHDFRSEIERAIRWLRPLPIATHPVAPRAR